MGRMTRAKYRRWRRREEELRRRKQAWTVASLCLVVLAVFAAYIFYDRVFVEHEPPEPPPPPEEPRSVKLIQPERPEPPPAPMQEQASSGEERPEMPKTRAKSRRIAIDRKWVYEQPNVTPVDGPPQPVVSNPGPATVIAPPAPPAPPAPVRASAPMAVPQKQPKVVRRVTQEKQKKKRVVRQKPVPRKEIIVAPPHPGPPNTRTLEEVEATPVDD